MSPVMARRSSYISGIDQQLLVEFLSRFMDAKSIYKPTLALQSRINVRFQSNTHPQVFSVSGSPCWELAYSDVNSTSHIGSVSAYLPKLFTYK